jgi:hypothetical protein
MKNFLSNLCFDKFYLINMLNDIWEIAFIVFVYKAFVPSACIVVYCPFASQCIHITPKHHLAVLLPQN